MDYKRMANIYGQMMDIISDEMTDIYENHKDDNATYFALADEFDKVWGKYLEYSEKEMVNNND